MSKSVRVTAILFMAFLLSLFLAVFGFAQSGQSAIMQYGWGTLDFESDSASTSVYSSSKTGKHTVSRFGSSSGNHTSVGVVDGTLNNYLQFKDNGKPTRKYSGNAYWELTTSPGLTYSEGFSAGEYSTSRYDFYVIEFDIMADEYLYTYRAEDSTVDSTVKQSLIPDGAEIISVKPAYTEGLLFSNVIKAVDLYDSETSYSFTNSFKLVSDDTNWYIYAGHGDALVNTGAVLSDEILIWNHFTVVVAIDRTDANRATSKQYTYLNGELINTDLMGLEDSSYSDFTNAGYRIEFPASEIWNDRYLYSVGVDNFSINYYMRSGSSYENVYVSDGYGLDDYFAEGDFEKGIYNCDDIVYNNSYIFGSPVAYVDGVAYYSMNTALDAIGKGSVVNLKRGLDSYIPTAEAFTVIARQNVKFALSDECTDYTVTKTSADGYNTYEVVSTKVDEELYKKVFDGAKYNLTTTTSFVGNFYVKVPDEEADYEIFLGEGSGYSGITEIEGEKYYKFCSESLIGNITSTICFEVKVTVEGVTKILKAQYTIDDYFSSAMKILTESENPTSQDVCQMKLVMNATRYANELYKYVNGTVTGYGKYENILENEKYSKYLTSYEDIENKEETSVDFSAVSSAVIGFSFAVHDGYGASFMIFVADENVKSDSLKITYKSITGEISELEIDESMTVIESGERIYYCFMCADMPIYEITSVQQITVTYEDGSVANATYTLAAYIEKQTNEWALSLAKALYVYSKLSYDFKKLK